MLEKPAAMPDLIDSAELLPVEFTLIDSFSLQKDWFSFDLSKSNRF